MTDAANQAGATVTLISESNGKGQVHRPSPPKGWELFKEGVYRIPERGNPQFVCGPAWVEARTISTETELWGLVVNWLDHDGKHHSQAIPSSRLHDRGMGLAQDLANGGLLIVPGQEGNLGKYLASFQSEKRVAAVTRIGWMGTDTDPLVFVLPNRIISRQSAGTVHFQPEHFCVSSSTIYHQGSLEQWQENVAALVDGNDLLIFAILCALTAPLMKPAGLENGGFHFHGLTSRGKTTTLLAAASVFGNGADPAQSTAKAYTRRWNTTINGAEGLAAAHNDLVLCLDELGSCTAKDVAAMIYNLLGGLGKAAMNKNRQSMPQNSWGGMLLSTGEISIEEKVKQSGGSFMGGLRVRLCDIPVEVIITDTHNMVASTYVDHIKHNCGEFFGVAGPAFVQGLVERFADMRSLRSVLIPRLEETAEQLAPDGLQPEQKRIVYRIALVKVAAEMAIDYGILPFTKKSADAAIRTVLGLVVQEIGALTEIERMIEQIRSFILRETARFRPIHEPDNPPQKLVGFISRDAKEYLLTKDGWEEACRGFDSRQVARELHRRGFLSRGESDRWMSRRDIPGFGKTSVYIVKRGIMETEESGGTAG